MTDTRLRPERPAGDTHASPTERPGGLPYLGHSISFGRDPLAFFEETRPYGDVVRYDAFGRSFVLVYDPRLIEQVLVSRSNEFWRGEFEHELGTALDIEGVFFAEGDAWQRQRRLLQSAFTPRQITTYATDAVEETIRLLERFPDDGEINARAAFTTLTLRILTRSLFDLELEGDRAALVSRWTHAMGEYIESETLGIRSYLPSWLPSRTAREYERTTDALEQTVETLVSERRAAGAGGDDLLSTLATATYPDGSRPSPREINDQLLTFLLAGHETTSTALTYATWLLADTEWQARLEQEVRTVCGDRLPTAGDLPSLAVTEAIAREALRLYPPLPFLHREPHEPCSLGNAQLSPGETVQIPMYSIHRDARWWDHPDAFNPGRWLTDDQTLETNPDDRPEYAYFPFGGGPRHCIGMRFAMMELTLTLATMAPRVELTRVTETLEPTVKVSLDPGPVKLGVLKQ